MIHHREEKWPERRKMLHEFEHTCTKFSHIGKKYIYIKSSATYSFTAGKQCLIVNDTRKSASISAINRFLHAFFPK